MSYRIEKVYPLPVITIYQSCLHGREGKDIDQPQTQLDDDDDDDDEREDDEGNEERNTIEEDGDDQPTDKREKNRQTSPTRKEQSQRRVKLHKSNPVDLRHEVERTDRVADSVSRDRDGSVRSRRKVAIHEPKYSSGHDVTHTYRNLSNDDDDFDNDDVRQEEHVGKNADNLPYTTTSRHNRLRHRNRRILSTRSKTQVSSSRKSHSQRHSGGQLQSFSTAPPLWTGDKEGKEETVYTMQHVQYLELREIADNYQVSGCSRENGDYPVIFELKLTIPSTDFVVRKSIEFFPGE